MSTYYRFTLKRKVDGKKLASFYYNMIKNVGEYDLRNAELKYDPNNLNTGTILSIDDINADRTKLELEKLKLENELSKKNDLIAKANNVDIKHDLELDINDINNSLKDLKYADEALVGLKAVVMCLTEDLVVKSTEDEDITAYKANAEGLSEGKYIWLSDVELEVEVC